MKPPFSPSPYNLTRNKNKREYLYTKGFEFSLDGENYIGEYHKQGSIYKTEPIESPTSKRLTKYYNDPLLYQYDKSRNFEERVRVVPNQIVWAPVKTNYTIEIDQEQKEKFGKDGGIDEGLYALATISWKLTGSERSIYKDNMLYIEGIYEYNQRQVIIGTKIIPNLEYAIKSYTEYARFTLS